MREETKDIGKSRAINPAAVRRQLSRIIDRHDDEVRVLVNADQWKLYDEFKPGLIEQLEASLDIMRVR